MSENNQITEASVDVLIAELLALHSEDVQVDTKDF
jgi:hypothetical protein